MNDGNENENEQVNQKIQGLNNLTEYRPQKRKADNVAFVCPKTIIRCLHENRNKVTKAKS